MYFLLENHLFLTVSLHLCDYTTQKVTSFQPILLQRIFDDNPYPSLALKWELASAMGVKRSKIDNWFKYRRRSRLKRTDLSVKKTCKLLPSANYYLHKSNVQ